MPRIATSANDMGDDGYELEVDRRAVAERKMKERAYLRAGVGEFTAFRLSMLGTDVDWHQVVAAAKAGASDGQLTRLYLD